MSRSEEISRAFYRQLGAEGLAARTQPEWAEKIVAAVLEMLPWPAARVLDVGCGYGRVALPLARAAYEIEGLDLSENLIESARRAADAEVVDLRQSFLQKFTRVWREAANQTLPDLATHVS